MIGLIPTASSYFIFIAILFTFNLSMNSMFGIFASILSNKAGVQGAASIILFISTLFGGFIVAPSVIPDYYSWIYWWNPFAWAYRALVVNAFARYELIETPCQTSFLLFTFGTHGFYLILNEVSYTWLIQNMTNQFTLTTLLWTITRLR
jgi:hypothetical protein